MAVLPVCLYVHHICAYFLQRSEESIKCPGTRGIELGSSAKAASALTTETSFQPQIKVF